MAASSCLCTFLRFAQHTPPYIIPLARSYYVVLTSVIAVYPCIAGLRQRAGEGGGVLNGIAYDASSGRIFVTGKLWSKVFEVAIEEATDQSTAALNEAREACLPDASLPQYGYP